MMKITLCIDKKNRGSPSEELKEYIIDIGCPLRSVDDVFDELKISTDDENKLIGQIIRRCYIDKYGILKKLEQEKIQELDVPNIELFEGTNYVYIKEFTNLNMKLEYLTNAEMNKYFATKMEMHSNIQQTSSSILNKVGADIDGLDKDLNAKIELKVDIDNLISEINASADVINLESNRFSMKSDYSSINPDGAASFKKGDIGGFIMDSTSFSKELDGIYDYSTFDLQLLRYVLLGYINLSQDPFTQNLLDANNDNNLNSADLLRIRQIILNEATNDKNIKGKIYINSDNPKNCLNVVDNSGNVAVSLGLGGLNSNEIVTQNIVCTNTKSTDTNSIIGVFIDGIGGNIRASGTVTQSSLASRKKNIEKYENALLEIKKIDIYKYNLIEENDNCKKHLGFVIGDNYRYSKTITNKENNQVELYSMISLCMQAIQEQQEIIEKLESRISELEKKVNANG